MGRNTSPSTKHFTYSTTGDSAVTNIMHAGDQWATIALRHTIQLFTDMFLKTGNCICFFERHIRNQLKLASNGNLPGITEQYCQDQLALLPRVLGQNRESTSFAMDRGDVKPANIIVGQYKDIKE